MSVYLRTSRNLRGLAKVSSGACGPPWGSWSTFHSSQHILKHEKLWRAYVSLCPMGSGCHLGALPRKGPSRLLLLDLPTSGASTLPQHRQYCGADAGWPVFPNHYLPSRDDQCHFTDRERGHSKGVLEQASWCERYPGLGHLHWEANHWCLWLEMASWRHLEPLLG